MNKHYLNAAKNELPRLARRVITSLRDGEDVGETVKGFKMNSELMDYDAADRAAAQLGFKPVKIKAA